MRGKISLLVVLSCLMPGEALTAADAVKRSASTKAKDAPPGEVCDILFFAPKGPLFIRAYVDVDNGSVEQFRVAYARKLFRSLDEDANGFLDAQEAPKIPLLENSQADSGLLNDGWTSVDTGPTDGKVSFEEFSDYVTKNMGGRFSIAATPRRATQQVRLFSRFDADSDGRVSKAELQQSIDALKKLDLDDDETFSIIELQPSFNPFFFRSVNSPQRAGDDDELPFVAIGPNSPAHKIASRLLKHYSRSAGDVVASTLTAGEIGLDRQTFDRFDTNTDGVLESKELQELIQNPLPHVEFKVRLPHRKRGQTTITMKDSTPGVVSDVQQATRKRLEMVLGGLPVQLRAKSSKFAASDNVSLFKLKMRMADGDKNQYLDETEFPSLQLPGARFQAVDADGDGKVFTKELVHYLKQKAAASQGRIEMIVSQDKKTLFEILDGNSDRRLSRRELMNGFEPLREFDLNHDGQLAASELSGRFRITIEVGKPRDSAGLTVSSVNNAAPRRLSPPSTGPTWFQKMDVNRDGDVSEREFLGTKTVFQKIDTDGDRLIDAREAENAKF